jgi:hypothetical protein
VAALQAHPQMNPGVPGFYAIFTNVSIGAGDADLVEMCTLRHVFLRVRVERGF